MPATLTSGLTSSMMMVTMLSVSVVSCCGSAASRRRMVEYWLWSAMQNSTGSGDVTNGSQNCFRAGGREAYQSTVEAMPSASRASTYRGFLPATKIRFERGAVGTVEARRTTVVSEGMLGNSSEVAGKPAGWPGQENCGA